MDFYKTHLSDVLGLLFNFRNNKIIPSSCDSVFLIRVLYLRQFLIGAKYKNYWIYFCATPQDWLLESKKNPHTPTDNATSLAGAENPYYYIESQSQYV